jgi:alpha-D-xyloside xylohydrolase
VVYPGADASFTLYEDEGDNYNYEKGQYSTILLTWNDRSKTLTIGKRTGSFAGMPITRTFNVKIVGGTTKTVTYSGKSVSVK